MEAVTPLSLRVFPIKPCDFARYLAIDGAFLQICALVTRNLPQSYADFSLHLCIFPVQLQNDERAAFYLRFTIESVDLLPVKQQFADTFCVWNFVAGAFVRLNISVVKERFAVFNSREGVANICLAGADRFNLTAF